jgi:hypothetical protein
MCCHDSLSYAEHHPLPDLSCTFESLPILLGSKKLASLSALVLSLALKDKAKYIWQRLHYIAMLSGRTQHSAVDYHLQPGRRGIDEFKLEPHNH